MKMNKYNLVAVLALGSLLAFGPAARAQDQTNSPPTRGQRGAQLRDHFAKVAKELNLTEEQKAIIRTVFQEEREKVKALRADTSLTRVERRAKVKEIRNDINAQVKGILTAEQYEKWQQIREETKQRVRERIRERLGKTGETG